MAETDDDLGLGMNLDDDGGVYVVLTLGDKGIPLAPEYAAMIGMHLVTLAGLAEKVVEEVATFSPEERAAGLERIRARFVAAGN